MKLTRKQLKRAAIAADTISILEEATADGYPLLTVTHKIGMIDLDFTVELQLKAIELKLSEARDVLAKLGVELVPEVKS